MPVVVLPIEHTSLKFQFVSSKKLHSWVNNPIFFQKYDLKMTKDYSA